MTGYQCQSEFSLSCVSTAIRPKSSSGYPIIPNLLGELRGHTAPILVSDNRPNHDVMKLPISNVSVDCLVVPK